MGLKRLFLLIITCLGLMNAPARSQELFVTGEAGVALIGPPLVSIDYGAVALTTRVGLGAEYDHFQVEFDVGVVSPPEFTDGFLVVPSLDASYMFRRPNANVRPYLGGGVDLIYVVSDFANFGLPWAHLTAGLDSKLNERSSFYVEGRTYGLETQFSLGSKFRF